MASCGCSITRAPVKRLAVHLDIAKEISEPPKPNTAAKTSSARITSYNVCYTKLLRKRILLFVATNIAVLLVLSVSLRLLGLESYLYQQGVNINYNALLVFAARITSYNVCYTKLLRFESRLFAKPDAARLLERELQNPAYRCKVIGLGTNTDPYQPSYNFV